MMYDIIAEPLRDEADRVIGVTTATKNITASKPGEETYPDTG